MSGILSEGEVHARDGRVATTERGVAKEVRCPEDQNKQRSGGRKEDGTEST